MTKCLVRAPSKVSYIPVHASNFDLAKDVKKEGNFYIKFAVYWIRTADLWCWKQPFYRFRHNHFNTERHQICQRMQVPVLYLKESHLFLMAKYFLHFENTLLLIQSTENMFALFLC